MSNPDEKPPVDPFLIEDFSDFMGSAVEEGNRYIDSQRDYYTLLATKKVAKGIGTTLNTVVALLLLGSVLVFMNIALALWLGELLASMSLGFLLVGSFYLLVYLIFFIIWRNGFKHRFTLMVINALHNEKD